MFGLFNRGCLRRTVQIASRSSRPGGALPWGGVKELERQLLSAKDQISQLKKRHGQMSQLLSQMLRASWLPWVRDVAACMPAGASGDHADWYGIGHRL